MLHQVCHPRDVTAAATHFFGSQMAWTTQTRIFPASFQHVCGIFAHLSRHLFSGPHVSLHLSLHGVRCTFLQETVRPANFSPFPIQCRFTSLLLLWRVCHFSSPRRSHTSQLQISLSLSSLEVLSWNSWWCFEGCGVSRVLVWASLDSSCASPDGLSGGRRGFTM